MNLVREGPQVLAFKVLMVNQAHQVFQGTLVPRALLAPLGIQDHRGLKARKVSSSSNPDVFPCCLTTQCHVTKLGVSGLTGSWGQEGRSGPLGQSGATGAPGKKGEKGLSGPEGAPGCEGMKGEKGEYGVMPQYITVPLLGGQQTGNFLLNQF